MERWTRHPTWSGRFLPHYPAVSAELALSSLVGLLLVATLCAPELSRIRGGAVLFMLVGAATAAVGLLDHRWMVRRLAFVSDEEPDVGPV